jgi:hypothetical protein
MSVMAILRQLTRRKPGGVRSQSREPKVAYVCFATHSMIAKITTGIRISAT